MCYSLFKIGYGSVRSRRECNQWLAARVERNRRLDCPEDMFLHPGVVLEYDIGPPDSYNGTNLIHLDRFVVEDRLPCAISCLENNVCQRDYPMDEYKTSGISLQY